MIKFGTDGWRAKIADEFTFENVRLVAQAMANYVLKTNDLNKTVLVGYDNRFLSENYASEIAKVIQASGISCLISDSSLSSPALSFAVKSQNASAGIMVTASHNPPEYNGIKFKASYGGSASVETTKAIENELETATPKIKDVVIKTFNPKKAFFSSLLKHVDTKAISSSNVKIIVDPMHGSASGYLTEILSKLGIPVTEINSNRDPLFNGSNPEPLPHNLEDLISVVKETSLENPNLIVFGIALDGDGDRISAVDQSGQFINPHDIFAILLKHLVENKKLKGEVVKSFNISVLIDRLAEKYKLKLNVTKIGFKYLCDLMLKHDVLIAGEESGGLGVRGHIPERDGVLIALLLMEAVAFFNKSLKSILNDIMEEHGFFYYDRIDLHLNDAKKSELMNKLQKNPPKIFAKNAVKQIENLDGIKLIMEDNSWILFRASGTEPLLRIYAEATSKPLLKQMLAEGEDLTK